MPFARALSLAAVAAALGLSVPLAAESLQETYAKRLAEISPRDADGHYELALWCRDKGLNESAQKLLERVIQSIDPDHPKARAELGYKRFGLGWRLAKDIPGEAGPEEETPEAATPRRPEPPAPSPAHPEPPPAAPRPSPPAPSPGSTPPTPGAESPSGETAVEKIEDIVQRKKRFAESAAQNVPLALTHLDDGDFLIHTTHPAGSRQLKTLQDELKKVKLNVLSILGVRPQTPIWPHRLQFFYLRAVECAQFSEKVLSKRFDDSSGWVEIDDDTLLLNRINSDDLALFAGRRALERLNGSRQWVSWWLREGLSGLVAAKSEEGTRRDRLLKAVRAMADLIKQDPKAYLLQDIFERPEKDVADGDRAQAMAMTFVDFLAAQRGKVLGRLVTELKSGDAVPPKDKGSPEFRSFTIDYLTLQDRLLRNHFRMNPEQLEDRWKEHVLERQKGLERQGGTKDRGKTGGAGEDAGRRRAPPARGGGRGGDSGGERKDGETKRSPEGS